MNSNATLHAYETMVGVLPWIFAIIGVGFLIYALHRHRVLTKREAFRRRVDAFNSAPFDPTVPGSSLGPAAFGWDNGWHEDPLDAIAQENVEHTYRRLEGQ